MHKWGVVLMIIGMVLAAITMITVISGDEGGLLLCGITLVVLPSGMILEVIHIMKTGYKWRDDDEAT